MPEGKNTREKPHLEVDSFLPGLKSEAAFFSAFHLQGFLKSFPKLHLELGPGQLLQSLFLCRRDRVGILYQSPQLDWRLGTDALSHPSKVLGFDFFFLKACSQKGNIMYWNSSGKILNSKSLLKKRLPSYCVGKGNCAAGRKWEENKAMNEAWRGQQEQENKVIYETRINRQSALPLIPACIYMSLAIHFWQWMCLPEGIFWGSPFEMRGEWLLSHGYSCCFCVWVVGFVLSTWCASLRCIMSPSIQFLPLKSLWLCKYYYLSASLPASPSWFKVIHHLRICSCSVWPCMAACFWIRGVVF